MNFKLSEDIAEIAGLFAADGSMQKKHLCFWGNITEDKDYYDQCISKLFLSAFKKKLNLHAKKSNSVYGFYVCDRQIICFFNKTLGFPVGSKTCSVRIPECILNNKNLKIKSAFLRGFADGDGCLTFHKRGNHYNRFKQTYHVYPRIFLTSVSFNLIEDIKQILDELCIGFTYRVRKAKKAKHNCAELILRGGVRLEEWMDFVGFRNPVNLTKYAIWKKFEFCPTHLTLNQRKQILQGRMDPFSFYH